MKKEVSLCRGQIKRDKDTNSRRNLAGNTKRNTPRDEFAYLQTDNRNKAACGQQQHGYGKKAA